MAISNTLAVEMLTAVKAELDGGFLYIYAGPVPGDADDALNMAGAHTELVKISVGGDGVTGLTFTTPTGPALVKTGAETWKGTINFDGYDSGTTTKAPTFFRFCTAADNGRGAASAPRLQGTCGGPASGKDLLLGADTLTDNGTNEQGVSVFSVSQAAV